MLVTQTRRRGASVGGHDSKMALNDPSRGCQTIGGISNNTLTCIDKSGSSIGRRGACCKAKTPKNLVAISKSYKETVKHAQIYWEGKEDIKTAKQQEYEHTKGKIIKNID